MKKLCSFIFIAGILFLTGIGCSLYGNKNAWQPVKHKKTPVVHLVQYRQETLPIIAEWYTGNFHNLEFVANANPNINPNHLFLGNEIFIPEHLVKTRAPMPEEFISAFYQKKQRKKEFSNSIKTPKEKSPERRKVAPLPKVEDEDEFEIFGPK